MKIDKVPYTIRIPKPIRDELLSFKNPAEIVARALAAELDRLRESPLAELKRSLGGITNTEIADRLGCSRASVSNWLLTGAPGPVDYFARQIVGARNGIKAQTGAQVISGGAPLHLTALFEETAVERYRCQHDIDPEEYAELLGCSPRTLERYLDPEEGPPMYIEVLAGLAILYTGQDRLLREEGD